MAIELFDNATSKGTETFLVDGISSTDTVLPTQDAASVILSRTGGQFRIIAMNPINGDTELMLVTGNAWTSNWTVTRGVESTIPLDFPEGTIIRHVYTAASIRKAGSSASPTISATEDFDAKPDGINYGGVPFASGQLQQVDTGVPGSAAALVGKVVVVADGASGGDALVTSAVQALDDHTVLLNDPVAAPIASTQVHIGTDNTTRLRAYISELISSGAKSSTSHGNYLHVGDLGFEEMQGSWKGVDFHGDGGGGFSSDWQNATNFWYAGSGPGIHAYGDGGNYLGGVKMGGFGLKCLKLTGVDNFSFFWDLVISNSEVVDLNISGYTGADLATFDNVQQGNGAWFNNVEDGAVEVHRLNVWNFDGPTSEGLRYGTDTTSHGAAGSCGSTKFTACMLVNVKIGLRFHGTGEVNGCSFDSFKIVAGSGGPGSRGFWIGNAAAANTFNAPWAEGFEYGYFIDGATRNLFNSPMASGVGTVGDGSSAFYLDNGARGNTIVSARIAGQYDRWVNLGAACYGGNRIEYYTDGDDFHPLTSELFDIGNNAQYNTIVPQGRVALGPQPLSLVGGITPVSGRAPFAKMNGDGQVELVGALTNTGALSGGAAVTALPAGLWPRVPRQIGHLLFGSDGSVKAYGAIGAGTEMSLDGIMFSVN